MFLFKRVEQTEDVQSWPFVFGVVFLDIRIPDGGLMVTTPFLAER